MLDKIESEEDVKYRKIYGGIAVPTNEHAGFVVVVGQTHELGYGGQPKYIILDEHEEWDLRELLDSCAWLDFRYGCEKWFADTSNPALDIFLRKLNNVLGGVEALKQNRRPLQLVKPVLLMGDRAKKSPYSFLIPQLNELLGGAKKDKDRKNLFVPEGSRLHHYMKQPVTSDAASLKFGDIPALDALCFALFSLVRDHEMSKHPYAGIFSVRNEPYDPLAHF